MLPFFLVSSAEAPCANIALSRIALDWTLLFLGEQVFDSESKKLAEANRSDAHSAGLLRAGSGPCADITC